MRAVVIAALLALLSPWLAEAKCKVEVKTNIDGESYWTAISFDQYHGKLAISYDGTDYTLTVPLWQVGDVDVPMVASGEIKFLLEDGATFSLAAEEAVYPVSAVWMDSQVLTTWNPTLVISRELIDTLAAVKIQAIQVPLATTPLDLDATKQPWKGLSTQLNKLAKCWIKKGRNRSRPLWQQGGSRSAFEVGGVGLGEEVEDAALLLA